MASAYKCDRCGSFFTEEDFGNDVRKYRVIDTGKSCFMAHMTVHLCPNCSKSLHTWMEYKDKPKTHHIYLKDPTDIYIDIHHPYPGGTKTFVKEKKKRWWRK